MAIKTLKEMRNDFDEDALEGISDDSKDLKPGVRAKILGVFKNIFSSKKTVMIMGVAMILFVGLVVGGVLYFGKSSEKVKGDQDKSAGKEDIKAAAPLVEKPVFEDIVVLKPFERIRLKKGSDMELISMNLSLELSDSRYRKEVQAMEDKIRQIITRQVESMTWLELRNPEGKIILKYDLLKQINSIFSEIMIRNIYFTNFLMQR